MLYGQGKPNVLLAFTHDDLARSVEARAFVVALGWDSEEENAQITAMELDEISGRILHVDFNRIDLSETITATVPFDFHGEAAGVKEGGVMDVHLREVSVECLPMAVPERIRIEVSELVIGDDVRLGQIEFPEGVTPLEDAETVVLSVTFQAVEEEEEVAEEAAEEAAAEPEVIGREEKEEEEEPQEESG